MNESKQKNTFILPCTGKALIMKEEGIESMYNVPFQKNGWNLFCVSVFGGVQEKYWNSLMIRRTSGPASGQSRPIRARPSTGARQQRLQSFYLRGYESHDQPASACRKKPVLELD